MEPAHTLMLALALPPAMEPMQGSSQSSFPQVFRHEPQGLGVGLYMGTPMGFASLNAALRTGRATQQLYINWNTNSSDLRLVFDQLWFFYTVPSDDRLSFPLYWGARGWMSLNELRNGLGMEGISQTVGVGLPVGITMYHRETAIDLYVEAAPVLQLVPVSRLGFQAGIGFRMYPTLPFIKAKSYKK